MYLTNQFPTLGWIGGLGNLQIWLSESALDEAEDQGIVVNGDKFYGRGSTCMALVILLYQLIYELVDLIIAFREHVSLS
jgi:hypothetical protein